MKPTVFIFSEPSSFTLYLLEKFLSSLCRVVLFSSDVKGWEAITSHIAKTSNLVLDSEKNYSKYPKPNHFLILDLLNPVSPQLIKKASLLSSTLDSKGFLIVSNATAGKIDTLLPERVGVILFNNLFGSRMELDQRSRISQILGATVRNEKVKIFEGEQISFIYMGDASKQLVKWLFSFGPYGEATNVSSTKIGFQELFRTVKKVYPDVKYQIARGSLANLDISADRPYLLGSNLKQVEETLSWFKEHKTQNKKTHKDVKTKNKGTLAAIISILIILATPFVFILVSVFLLYLSVKIAVSENFKVARFFTNTSYFSSYIASKSSSLLTYIPLVGELYKPASSVSSILKDLGVVGSRGFDLINDVSLLSDNILGSGEYDTGIIQQKITSNLSFIETTLSFIEIEADNYPSWSKKIDLVQIQKLTTNAYKISTVLSDLMGINKTKTYLVLFQNNMELRPTGGFIGSFALATLNAGKLDEINVQDIYSADGQLKGHIEPPVPIKKYLNEANWFLRDSNWDPNFPVSAERAEWFLDKEIDVPVDGVIAIDLNVIKDLLGVMGPVYLTDYQTQITSDNFYEKTQTQAEENFFPGSTKKASFITALTKEITRTLVSSKEKNKAGLAKIIYNNLEARHIQIFLHNNTAKEAFNELNWDGDFNYPNCTGNCYSDFLGLVEANLGVNKSNYYIQRKYNLSVNLDEGVIRKKLLINYTNNADLAIGEGGVYKVYSRLLSPLNSTLDYVKLGGSELKADIETVSGRKEIGYYFELSPGQTKTLTISWQIASPTSLGKGGEYLLYFRKQAGTLPEALSINFDTASAVDLTVLPGYNTLFAKDIYSKVRWTK